MPLAAHCSQDMNHPPVNPLQSCTAALGMPGIPWGGDAGQVLSAGPGFESAERLKVLGVFAPQCVTASVHEEHSGVLHFHGNLRF